MSQITPLERARRRRAESDDLIDLTSSDFRAFGCVLPEPLYEEVWRRWRCNPAYRPSGRGGLAARQEVCALYGAQARPEEVILTSGTSVSYTLLFSWIAERGGRVALPSPGYPLFEELARYAGVNTLLYPVYPPDWLPEPARLAGSLPDDTLALVLVTPNNPCGVAYPDDLLRSFARLAAQRDLLLLVDEVFSLFGPTGRPGWQVWTEAPATVVHMEGLSKRFASPELKGGWIAMQGPSAADLAEELDTRHDLLLTLSAPAEHAIEVLLSNPRSRAEQERWRSSVAAARIDMRNALAAIPGVRVTGGTAGIHAILTVDQRLARNRWGTADDEAIAVALVEECGLYLHPGYLYGIAEVEHGGDPSLVITALHTGPDWEEVSSRLRSTMSL